MSDWRASLPVLTGRLVVLREPTTLDAAAIVDLLSIADASRFGLEYPIDETAVRAFVMRMREARAAGLGFTYACIAPAFGALVGLAQVRQLDAAFEGAEWECTLAPSVRGTGLFVEMARLIGSFAFTTVGAYRLEARVLLQNGRANGALRKIGAVQEGVLRRSLRRNGEYFDQVLWSVLKDDWTDSPTVSPSRIH